MYNQFCLLTIAITVSIQTLKLTEFTIIELLRSRHFDELPTLKLDNIRKRHLPTVCFSITLWVLF